MPAVWSHRRYSASTRPQANAGIDAKGAEDESEGGGKGEVCLHDDLSVRLMQKNGTPPAGGVPSSVWKVVQFFLPLPLAVFWSLFDIVADVASLVVSADWVAVIEVTMAVI
jgi:hypothetical protein